MSNYRSLYFRLQHLTRLIPLKSARQSQPLCKEKNLHLKQMNENRC